MRRGFTLIEVLIAATIMTFGLAVLLTAVSRCLAVVRMAKNYQTAQVAMGMGEARYPLVATNEVKAMAVSATEVVEGFTFEREVEDDENEDGLYVVRTRVRWTEARREATEETVRYVLQQEE